MRSIKKAQQPQALTSWRNPRMVSQRPIAMECTYEELRRDAAVLATLEDSLFKEQGGLCAYTGIKIGLDRVRCDVDFHIEHLRAQTHCTYGQDTEYTNLVGCWPRPNVSFEPKFGARRKADWPALKDEVNFVSPLSSTCSKRFRFETNGQVHPALETDAAAVETISRLQLNHKELRALRSSAIKGAIFPRSQLISLAEARRLLAAIRSEANSLDGGAPGRLMSFSFAIEDVLSRVILKQN